jgi:hypothetical protein
LLREEAVVDAYNSLITCLVENSSKIVVFFKKDDLKYIRQITLHSPSGDMTALLRSNGRIGIDHHTWVSSIHSIHQCYKPLYYLIKDDLVPIINEKDKLFHATVMIPQWRKQIIHYIEQQIKNGTTHKMLLEKRSAALNKSIATINSNHDARMKIYKEQYENKLQAMHRVLEAIHPDLPEKRRIQMQLTQQKKIIDYQHGYTIRMDYHERKKERKIARFIAQEQAVIDYMERKHVRYIERFDSYIAFYLEEIKKNEIVESS